MKKYLALILALVMSLSLVACGGGEDAAEGGEGEGDAAVEAYWDASDVDGSIASAVAATDGKVAIITNPVSQNEEEYRSAEFMVEKYGADRVIHATMPDNFMAEQEQFISVVNKCASDPAVKCIIINQAVLQSQLVQFNHCSSSFLIHTGLSPLPNISSYSCFIQCSLDTTDSGPIRDKPFRYKLNR